MRYKNEQFFTGKWGEKEKRRADDGFAHLNGDPKTHGAQAPS